jgi:hypothetical protein
VSQWAHDNETSHDDLFAFHYTPPPVGPPPVGPPLSAQQYRAQQAQDREWCGDIELAVLAILSQRRIFVFQDNDGIPSVNRLFNINGTTLFFVSPDMTIDNADMITDDDIAILHTGGNHFSAYPTPPQRANFQNATQKPHNKQKRSRDDDDDEDVSKSARRCRSALPPDLMSTSPSVDVIDACTGRSTCRSTTCQRGLILKERRKEKTIHFIQIFIFIILHINTYQYYHSAASPLFANLTCSLIFTTTKFHFLHFFIK